MLIMFYTPWCGACKNLKPVYAEVAKLVHDEGIILAAVDCELGKDVEFSHQLPYNVTAFPTMFYFQGGKLQFKYNHGHKKDDILRFLDNPSETSTRPSWSDKIDSKTVHLTTETYDSYIADHANVMVFFHALYANDLCAEVMIEWDKAAAELLEDESQEYFLAAVDCDAYPGLKEREEATYIPHIIYFRDGQVLYNDLGTEFRRNQEGIINYLKTPTKPEEKGATWDQKTENVNHLTAETFKKTIKKFKHGLVFFYTAWCGACKDAKPEFSSAADELQSDNKVTMVGLDCGPYKSLCRLYGVNSYPTIMYFHYGKNEQVYSGSRSSDALVSFMSDPIRGLTELAAAATPPKVDVDELWNVADGDIVMQLTIDTLAIQRRSTEKYILYLYGAKCGICNKIKLNIIEGLKTLEEAEIDAPFYAMSTDIFSGELTAQYDFWNHGMGVPCFLYFDGAKFLFEVNPRTPEDFVKFFKNPTAPKKQHQDPDWSLQESAADIYFLQDTGFDSFMKDQEEMLVMFYSNSCGHCSRAKPLYEEAAKLLTENRPVITLAAVDMANGNELGKRYNINSFPQFYYFSNGQMRYQYHGARTTEKIIEFCNDPNFIEPPKIEGGFEIASNVTILGNQADDWIKTTDSCLIMIHTAWCGHCKAMKPDYIMAADDLKEEKSAARLAAIEGDRFKSWHAPYGVTGFPTLLYFEKGEFKYKYEGQRTREAIVKFMLNPDPNFAQQQVEEKEPDEMLIDIPDEVGVLDHKNFEDFVEQYPKVVVMFYAPWCGVCKSSKPSFFEAAELMADEDDQLRFAIFNADSDVGEDNLYVQQFDVTSYPAIWFFDDGEQKYRFSGHHNVDSYLR